MNKINDPNGTQLLKDIVNYENIPRKIVDFWSALTGLEKKDDSNPKSGKKGKSSKQGKNGPPPQQEVEARTIKQMEVVSVLNRMLEMNRPENVDLMAWYEIFRDIFIMRARNAEKKTEAPKTARFTTFDLSFEQLAFLPEYWFNRTGKTIKRLDKELEERDKMLATWDKKLEKQGEKTPEERREMLEELDKAPLPRDPSQLLFSFERFMYDQDGGACWCAIDWGLPKYCFRVVCDKKNDAPLLNVASLLLTAQSIVSGKMGLYVGEKTDVKLSYAEIPGNKLLKYYHFDRFSGLSFIRKPEVDPKHDADAASLNAKFENSWQYLGMMTEFILQNNSARATVTTCSRVSLNTFIRALNTLTGINALGKVPVNRQKADALVLAIIDASIKNKEIGKGERNSLHKCISQEIDRISIPDESKIQLLKDINNAINLLDSPAKLVEMSPEKLIDEIGVEGIELIQPDFYLKYQGIDSAEKFWEIAEKVFNEIEKEYKLIDSQTVKRFTLDDLSKRIPVLPSARDCEDLKQRLLNAQQNQTRATMRGERLLAALKPLLIPGPGEIEPEFTINCAQLTRILDCSFDEDTLSLHPKNPNESKTGDTCKLPVDRLTYDFDPAQKKEGLRRYFLEILTALTKNKKGECKMNFMEDEECNLKKAQEESSRLWRLFFDEENEEVLLDRWMLSLEESIDLLKNEKAKVLTGVILPNGKDLLLPTGEERENLLKANKNELEELNSRVSKGKKGKKVENGKVYYEFPEEKCYSFDDISSITRRYLVFIDLIARTMVATAVSSQMTSMWDKNNENNVRLLKSFFAHLLYAIPKQKKHKPLRFHLSFDLITLNARERSKFDQGDYFNRLLGKHEFANIGDRYLLLLMLVDHLREETNPKDVLQTIIDNPSIAEFLGKKRLEQLNDYL